MSRAGRLRAETVAAGRAFLRRRTAVFFTFLFPAIIVLIFGALVQTAGGSGGLFTRPAGYYVPGYLAVVVLFTPLSRVGNEVARHRAGNRFEKLATTPLRRWEWLLGQALVNVTVVGLAGAGLLALVTLVTDATIRLSAAVVPVVAVAVALGVALFCGFGAILGRVADSQDGVVAASNGIALPLLFLSETFVPPALLPDWIPLWASPLTYVARAVRAVTYGGEVTTPLGGALGDPAVENLLVLAGLALAFFVAGAAALPRTD